MSILIYITLTTYGSGLISSTVTTALSITDASNCLSDFGMFSKSNFKSPIQLFSIIQALCILYDMCFIIELIFLYIVCIFQPLVAIDIV